MTKACEGLTIHNVSFEKRRGPVFYASLPCGPSATETRRVCGTSREEVKHRIVSLLWDYLVALESPFWKYSQSFDKAACQLKVVRGLLGRPHLMLGKYQGPAISFSEGGGKIWAALCADDAAIGIDAAETHEFKGAYPVHRVFHPQELQHASMLAEGDMAEASALLWSIKEAVVKAIGCGFHLVDPLDLSVCSSAAGAAERATEGGNDWYTFSVSVSGKALARVANIGGAILVRSLSLGEMWLSIALLDRIPAEHG